MRIGDLGGTESNWGGGHTGKVGGRRSSPCTAAPINNRAKLGLSYPSALIKRKDHWQTC
jgi:hypothetical protein